MPINLLSNLLNRPEEPYIRPSFTRNESEESIASDATAPNNPGPGRNVGRLYDELGARLEHVLKRTSAVEPQPARLCQGVNAVNAQLDGTDSIDSIATNATAPNLPGPGRNVGRLFDALGAKIEIMMNRRAQRLKLGPDAVAQEIRQLCRYCDVRRAEAGQPEATDREYRTTKKLCRKLLRYCR